MIHSVLIREFCTGDENALHTVFDSSVHQLTRDDYTEAQREAWAPKTYDATAWTERVRSNRPFVALCDDRIVGFADVQASGLIDQFYVHGDCTGRGVGRALMRRIHEAAEQRGIVELCSDVSLTAEPFFAAQGFVLVARQTVVRRGVELRNARMTKRLHTNAS